MKRNTVKTIREAAAKLGHDRSTLQGWIAEGCPGKTARGLDLDAIKRWKDENKGEPRGVAASGDDADSPVGVRLKTAQAREREARAELVELQLKLERGEFVAKHDVEEWDRARVTFLKRGISELPRSFGQLLVGLSGHEIEAATKKRIRELFEKFARM